MWVISLLQKCRGVSLNDLLIKGPDVLNPIRAVLLRFRGGVYAALVDISKMYNSVWLEDREMHLHRFLWWGGGTGGICHHTSKHRRQTSRVYCTTSHVGNCILPPFTHLTEEPQVLQQNSYVNDILTSHNDLDRLKVIAGNVEQILKAGGFELKPWVFFVGINKVSLFYFLGKVGGKNAVTSWRRQKQRPWSYRTKCGMTTTKHLAWATSLRRTSFLSWLQSTSQRERKRCDLAKIFG